MQKATAGLLGDAFQVSLFINQTFSIYNSSKICFFLMESETNFVPWIRIIAINFGS